MAGTRAYHAANFFFIIWNIVAEKYKEYGGDLNDLIIPMRIPYLEKHVATIDITNAIAPQQQLIFLVGK